MLRSNIGCNFFSYEKKNVSYALKVPEGLAVYIYNDSTQKYEKKSKVPHGYALNESKTYCESGGEVINYNIYKYIQLRGIHLTIQVINDEKNCCSFILLDFLAQRLLS